MAREGKQKGERVTWGSALLCSPLVQPKVEVQGDAALAHVAGIKAVVTVPPFHLAAISVQMQKTCRDNILCIC